MFNAQNVGERGGSRPFVVGLVLLLLFLSTTQDWGSPPRNTSRKQLKESTPQDVAVETKEIIIRNLVRSNEKLEAENGELRLELAVLRSASKSRRSMNNGRPSEDVSESASEQTTTSEDAQKTQSKVVHDEQKTDKEASSEDSKTQSQL